MAEFREREEDENDNIPVDLKQKVCPTCRRKLQPWELTCPEDGAAGVEGVTMGAVEDGILGRLNPDLFAFDDDLDAPEAAGDPVDGDQPAAAPPAADPMDAPAGEVYEVSGDLPDTGPPDRQLPPEVRWGAI